MVEHYGTTLKTLRLETERENLTYVLSHTQLTEQEKLDVRRRLDTVETEMLELLNAKFPN